MQLPLPKPLDNAAVIAAIDPDKDVDGLSIINAGRPRLELAGAHPPARRWAAWSCCATCWGDLSGKRAVVIGRSNLMGKTDWRSSFYRPTAPSPSPIPALQDLPAVCREADILVAAVGRAEMVKEDWIKPGAVVIDVGINRVPSKDPEKAARR